MHIGEKIKQYRESKGWTLSRLAQESGVSKPYLSQIENTPNKKISAELLYSISNALDVTMADLMGKSTVRSEENAVPAVPESLRSFAEKAMLNEETVNMLANIKYRGKQPSEERDWEYIYHTIKLAVERKE